MKIKKYLKSVRNEKIKMDLASISFVLIMIFTGLMLILILLESVFYFSPLFKKLVLWAIMFSFLIIMLWLVISYIIIKKNRNKKYSWNYLAKIIGKVIFPKNQDTALNAFQITSSYDNIIWNWLNNNKSINKNYFPMYNLKYGCNPHQKPSHVLQNIEKSNIFNVLNGSPGYINYLDAWGCWILV